MNSDLIHNVLFWTALATEIIGLGLCAGTLFGYCREVEDLRTELAEMRAELVLAKRSVQGIALRIARDDTGPIDMDRPTPQQQVSPTRPDLTQQRPVPNGATAVGRHRMPR